MKMITRIRILFLILIFSFGAFAVGCADETDPPPTGEQNPYAITNVSDVILSLGQVFVLEPILKHNNEAVEFEEFAYEISDESIVAFTKKPQSLTFEAQSIEALNNGIVTIKISGYDDEELVVERSIKIEITQEFSGCAPLRFFYKEGATLNPVLKDNGTEVSGVTYEFIASNKRIQIEGSKITATTATNGYVIVRAIKNSAVIASYKVTINAYGYEISGAPIGIQTIKTGATKVYTLSVVLDGEVATDAITWYIHTEAGITAAVSNGVVTARANAAGQPGNITIKAFFTDNLPSEDELDEMGFDLNSYMSMMSADASVGINHTIVA